MKYIAIRITVTALFLITAGCGGGGGGGATSQSGTTAIASSLTFPISGAIKSYYSQSHSLPFKITMISSGNQLSGSGTVSLSSPVSATVNGGPALARNMALTGVIGSNGVNLPIATTYIEYYDLNLNFISSVGSEYKVASTNFQLPTSARVGDTGTWYVYDRYTSPSSTVFKIGTGSVSYVMEAETSSTALLKFIEQGATITTTTFRVSEGGAISMLGESSISSTLSSTISY